MNLLLIEDQRPLALALVRILRQEGFIVSCHSNGTEGLDAALTGDYDLVILDLLLPGTNGWTICKEIRNYDSDIPILMLSALDTAADKVKGLDTGADDFLAKPFDNAELVARIHALLRKRQVHRGQVIRVADLEIHRDQHRVERKGKQIPLTMSEFELLVKLAVHEGRLVKPSILAHNLPLAPGVRNPLESCMASLRAKVDGPFDIPLIRNLDGDYLLCAAA